MGEIILLIVLCVLLIAMFAMSYAKKKKYNEGLSTMREELKKGDKVMTDSGIVGEIVDSYVEEEYKYFVIKSGKGNNVSFFSVHANAIFYVFGKEETKLTTSKAKAKTSANAKNTDAEPVNENKKVENLVTDQLVEENNKVETNQKPETKTKQNKSNKKSKK